MEHCFHLYNALLILKRDVVHLLVKIWLVAFPVGKDKIMTAEYL